MSKFLDMVARYFMRVAIGAYIGFVFAVLVGPLGTAVILGIILFIVLSNWLLHKVAKVPYEDEDKD